MDKSERCMTILEQLQREQRVRVEALAKQFAVSEMTIRRDLNALAKQYNITRTHGGAFITNQSVVRMVSFDESRISHKAEKEKIAKKASALIRNGQRLFIDAGSTTRIMLDYVKADTRAVIVTNHLKVAEKALQFEQLSTIMLGGEMLKITNCSSGAVAEEQIRRYQLDIAFLGAAAVGTDGRLYDGYSPEARLKTSIFSVAEKVYLLADSSKFNTYDLNDFGSLAQVSGVITDEGLDENARALLEKYGVELMIA